MTFVAALLAPRGRGADPQLKRIFNIAEGVVLVADSRFSSDGESVTDSGAKLWFIAPGVLAGFAGHVDNAQKALTLATRQISRLGNSYDFESLTVNLQSSLQEAWRPAWRIGQERVWLLVGMASQNGAARIVRFESQDNFSAVVATTDQTIGIPQDSAERYLSDLNDRIVVSGGPEDDGKEVITGARSLASYAAMSHSRAIKMLGQLVGGPTQVAFVERGSTTEWSLSEVMMDQGNVEWRPITANQDEVQSYMGRDEHRKYPSGR